MWINNNTLIILLTVWSREAEEGSLKKARGKKQKRTGRRHREMPGSFPVPGSSIFQRLHGPGFCETHIYLIINSHFLHKLALVGFCHFSPKEH